MSRRHVIALCVSSVFFVSSAFAQATRTWISGVGDDANPCSRTAPCKTFAGAISKTAAAGEINVLDPGGFGALTITKSITLLAVGVPAGVLVSGTNGIVINNTTGATMNVTIRGLDIDGLGNGLSGILVTGGGATTNVRIENNIIYGFATAGVNIAPSAAANVTLVGNRISDCVSSPGILADSTSGAVSLTVNSTEVHNCSIGLNVIGGTKFNAKNSDFSQNVTGVDLAGGTTIGTLDTDTIAYCTTGLNLETSAATVRLTNDTITDNATGMATASGGNIVSFGNNRTKGNTANGAPTATLVQN